MKKPFGQSLGAMTSQLCPCKRSLPKEAPYRCQGAPATGVMALPDIKEAVKNKAERLRWIAQTAYSAVKCICKISAEPAVDINVWYFPLTCPH